MRIKSARGLVCLCLVATLVLASVGLAGCGKSSENKPEGNEGSKPLKAALVSGPVSDAGWNAAGYDGLKAAEKELGATVSNTEVNAPAEYEEAIRSYASQGFDVIFAHGFQFQDAAKKVAAEYPNTAIIVVSGTEPSGSNMSPMIFLEEQGFYDRETSHRPPLQRQAAPPGGGSELGFRDMRGGHEGDHQRVSWGLSQRSG
ncbi:MAG TPA: BMP family ABC transporter substrate-binding protein [Firmicutes bacterium]|nr:BMP family ABC transporter substrate-binding protein [Bacillota bacterium]